MYKVADKVFLIVTDDPDELIITVKADPIMATSYVGIIRPSSQVAI